jgi:hypothetical protein
MSKTAMIEISNEELFVFGKQISRHPTFPWLFSITDVYKACERPIKHQAEKYGKDPEKVFKSKAPAQYMKNVSEEKIDAAAYRVRIRVKKYGAGCGFGGKAKKSDVTIVTSVRPKNSDVIRITSLTNREVCIQVVKGNFSDKKLSQGTYVCQDLIVSYAGFLNEKLRAAVIDTFISVMNGYTQEVTEKVSLNEKKAKGTQARADNIELNNRLVEACGMKKVLPMKVQEGINTGVLGMTATKYKKKFGLSEPFNDNLTEAQIDLKNATIALSTYKIRTHVKDRLTHKEGYAIGVHCGNYVRGIN